MRLVFFLSLLVLVAMVAGGSFNTSADRFHRARLLAAAVILGSGLILLGPEIWERSSWPAIVWFAIGIAVQRYLFVCPCGRPGFCVHRRSGVGLMIIGLMFVHSLGDGHLLAQLTDPVSVGAMVLHKFCDGLALMVMLGAFSRLYRWSALLFVSVASPLGLVFLPKDILSPLAEGIVLSVLLGVYAATSYSLARSAPRPTAA